MTFAQIDNICTNSDASLIKTESATNRNVNVTIICFQMCDFRILAIHIADR